jgi:pyridoxamine 5'-phosphate oxidase
MNPIELADGYFSEMKSKKKTTHFCLSTTDESGFPDSRFLDLKHIDEAGFYFGTDSRSKKARQFVAHKRVSACLWWENLGIQIRIRGEVFRAGAAESNSAFAQRNLTAQATSTLSEQSLVLGDPEDFRTRVLDLVRDSQGPLARPSTWWLWGIAPTSLEFLEFTEDRIHTRNFFQRQGNDWNQSRLFP